MKDASHGAGIVQHGVHGEWARVRGLVAPLWPLPVCAFFAGAFAATLFAGASAAFRSFAAGALIVAVLAAAWVWRRGVRRVESYFIGARGEEAVAAVLRTLPLPGHVFHDFKTPCGVRRDSVLIKRESDYDSSVFCREREYGLHHFGFAVDRVYNSLAVIDSQSALHCAVVRCVYLKR